MDKFNGSIENLMAIISTIDMAGDWQITRKKVVYRACDGTVVNWWPTTKTINFQGPELRAEIFEERFWAAAAEVFSRGNISRDRPVPAVILQTRTLGRQFVDGSTPSLIQDPRPRPMVSIVRLPSVQDIRKPGKWK